MTKRNWRKDAHHYFDILWLYKLHNSGKNIRYWRNKQYTWLAKKLGIPKEECHMSTLSIDMCKQVVNVCSKEIANNDKIMEFADGLEQGKFHRLKWFRIK